jgi:hypothetical protein
MGEATERTEGSLAAIRESLDLVHVQIGSMDARLGLLDTTSQQVAVQLDLHSRAVSDHTRVMDAFERRQESMVSTWRRRRKLSRGSWAPSHHRRQKRKMMASWGGLQGRGSCAQSRWAVGERHRAACSYQALLPRRGLLMAVVAQTHSTSTWDATRHGKGLHQHMSNILVVTMGALQITLLVRYLSR